MNKGAVEAAATLDIASIRQAQQLIAPHVKGTPLERSESLSRHLGTNVFVKYEMFQTTGSFKARGAFNKMLSLSEEEKRKGVVAVSGGNHAQAVAYAAGALGLKAVIIMPQSTAQVSIEATRGYGATVDLQPTIADAFAEIERYRSDGMTFVHPFDDPLVMAGQGTVGLEIADDLPGVTDVFVSIGGGGLAAGVSSALKAHNAEIRVWGVETEGADAMAQALDAGRPVELHAITSIAKTLGAPHVSEGTLEFARKNLEGVTVVSDADAVRAMVLILERLKVITEPAASCTLAAAERKMSELGPERNVVLIFCGGNTGVGDLCNYLSLI